MSTQQAERALLACCTSPVWAAAVAAGRPYGSADDLYDAADQAIARLAEPDLQDVLDGHPRIGERAGTGHNVERSRREQSKVAGADAATLAALADANLAYERQFGY